MNMGVFLIRNGWKMAGVLLLIYAIPQAWLAEVSVQVILHETIRNLYFHVTMWFAMIAVFAGSVTYSVKAMRSGNRLHDIRAEQFAQTGMIFGFIGIVTGMIWAQFTWGAPWVNDPKLNGSAVSLMIYLAYFVLRGSITDPVRRLKTAAVYNLFSFVMLLLLIGLMPRLTDSLHPGNGGNPGFGGYDLKNTMKAVFYPSVLGWILIGFWMAGIKSRIKIAKYQIQEENASHL
jgi:heme exporter protein C